MSIEVNARTMPAPEEWTVPARSWRPMHALKCSECGSVTIDAEHIFEHTTAEWQWATARCPVDPTLKARAGR